MTVTSFSFLYFMFWIVELSYDHSHWPWKGRIWVGPGVVPVYLPGRNLGQTMAIHTTPEACNLLEPMYFFEGVTGNALVEDSTRTGNSFCTVFPLPLGWVHGLFRVNGLGADFWVATFPRVTDAASGGASHASLPGAMNVLTPLGWMIASNHVCG